MRRYDDLADFFDGYKQQMNLQSLPRNARAAQIAQEPMYRRLVTDWLHKLERQPAALTDPRFLQFFQVTDEYCVPARDSRRLSESQAGMSVPKTWPQRSEHWAPTYASDASQAAAPLAWESALQPPPAESIAPLTWPTVPATDPGAEAPISWATMQAPGDSSEAPLSWEGLNESRPNFLLPARGRQARTAGGHPATPSTDPSLVSPHQQAAPSSPATHSGKAGNDNASPGTVSSGTQSSSSPEKGWQSSGAFSSSGAGGSRPWCVICMAKPEEVAVDPCGHLSMCQGCAEQVQQCPVCRGPIGKLLRVFVVR